MLEFLKSDVGKVALGGAIAVCGQLAVTLIAWGKEAWFDASKRKKEAELLAMRLVLSLDELVSACYIAVFDPLRRDEQGISESTAPDPEFSLPAEGDYKALPRHLMYEVMSMPNRLDGIKAGLMSVSEDSFPPDYDEYYEYRELHLAQFGLKALSLIDALCKEYRIPPPDRPEHYSPLTSFADRIAQVKQSEKEREISSREMMQRMGALPREL